MRMLIYIYIYWLSGRSLGWSRSAQRGKDQKRKNREKKGSAGASDVTNAWHLLVDVLFVGGTNRSFDPRVAVPGQSADTDGTGGSHRTGVTGVTKATGHTHRTIRTGVTGGSGGTNNTAGTMQTMLSRLSHFSSLTLGIFSILFRFSVFGFRGLVLFFLIYSIHNNIQSRQRKSAVHRKSS